MQENKIVISSYKCEDLYFTVGISSVTGKIVGISLPKTDENQAIAEIIKNYPNYELSDAYKDVVKDIAGIYYGKETQIKLDMLEFNVDKSNPVKSKFVRDVLFATFNIPYGEVETYKTLAEKVGTKAYRAVGTVMARNPFPFVVPCHRVVKTGLTLGNYGGGRDMKRNILKREGVNLKGDKIVKK